MDLEIFVGKKNIEPWIFFGPQLWSKPLILLGMLKMVLTENLSSWFSPYLEKMKTLWTVEYLMTEIACLTWFWTCPIYSFFILDFGPLNNNPSHWKYRNAQTWPWAKIWAVHIFRISDVCKKTKKDYFWIDGVLWAQKQWSGPFIIFRMLRTTIIRNFNPWFGIDLERLMKNHEPLDY